MQEDKKNIWKKFINYLKKDKKTQIIAIGIVVVLVVVLIIGIVLSSKNIFKQGQTNTNQAASSSIYRVIDGIKVDSGKTNLLPIAIVVENLVSVRPQHGLEQANIVYETLAEGGITRFLAMYANDEDIETIGPVRSARHYFVDIVEEYGGIFAHVGGSPQALGILSYEEYITDLNQFTYSQYYWRDINIPAPHNLFTSSEFMSYAVRDLLSENPEGDYEAWLFKDEAPSETTQDINITIDFSSEDYHVEWKYNVEENNYERYNGGTEHKTAESEEILTTKNIIVQYAETGLLPNENERLDIKTQGTGKAVIFRDGTFIEGTWKKDDRGNRTKYYDVNNEEIEFNRGTTWIEIVDLETPVEWSGM